MRFGIKLTFVSRQRIRIQVYTHHFEFEEKKKGPRTSGGKEMKNKGLRRERRKRWQEESELRKNV